MKLVAAKALANMIFAAQRDSLRAKNSFHASWFFKTSCERSTARYRHELGLSLEEPLGPENLNDNGDRNTLF